MGLLNDPCFVSKYTVTRPDTAGSWVKGRWVESATESTFTISASVQRLTPKETELLPEAFRTRSAYRVYTKTELLTVDPTTSKNSDSIEIRGDVYDVLDVEYWDKIEPHYKAIVVRRENVPT